MSARDKTVHVPITHVVCDCDGVLVDSESVAYLALLDVLSVRLCSGHPGGPGADREAGSFLGDGARVVGRASLAQAIQQRLGLTIEVLLGQVATLAGEHLSDREVAFMRDAVEGAVRTRQTPVPGIADALAAVGLPVAVASNSSLQRVREAVACSGVGALVGDRLFTADVVGIPKPAPDIYLAACAGFGAALPAHCLAIEDSLAGVRAAVSAGMQVLGFAGGSHIAAGPDGAAHLAEHVRMLRNAGALGVFDDMRALPGIVAALQRRALYPLVEDQAASFLSQPELIRLPAVLSDVAR